MDESDEYIFPDTLPSMMPFILFGVFCVGNGRCSINAFRSFAAQVTCIVYK